MTIGEIHPGMVWHDAIGWYYPASFPASLGIYSGWHPIQTAPRDETVVLLFCPESWDSNGVRIGWWFEGENNDSGWYQDESSSNPLTDLYGEPTYWMSSPLPPI